MPAACRGVRLGDKPKLILHPQREALERHDRSWASLAPMRSTTPPPLGARERRARHSARNLDRVHTVVVEGEMGFDRRDGVVGRLIGPDRIAYRGPPAGMLKYEASPLYGQ